MDEAALRQELLERLVTGKRRQEEASASVPIRAMLDSNIFDLIAASPGLTEKLVALRAAELLEILTTHVQEEQLAAIPDEELRKREAIARVPRTMIPTGSFVLGYSRLNLARLGDGGVFGEVRGESQTDGNVKDALIVDTAAGYADLLVANDKRILARAPSHVSVVDFEGFCALVDRLDGEYVRNG